MSSSKKNNLTINVDDPNYYPNTAKEKPQMQLDDIDENNLNNISDIAIVD